MSDDLCDDPECMRKRHRIVDELVNSTKGETEEVPNLGFDEDPLSEDISNQKLS